MPEIKELFFSTLSTVRIDFIFALPLLAEKEIKTLASAFVDVIDAIGAFVWRKNFFLPHAAIEACTAYQEEAL